MLTAARVGTTAGEIDCLLPYANCYSYVYSGLKYSPGEKNDWQFLVIINFKIKNGCSVTVKLYDKVNPNAVKA